MSKQVVIVGGGVIGLCAAYYCLERGLQVTVVERNGCERDSCSLGNAGLIVPSHFVPLAAPGMVALGLKWMASPQSPFTFSRDFQPSWRAGRSVLASLLAKACRARGTAAARSEFRQPRLLRAIGRQVVE